MKEGETVYELGFHIAPSVDEADVEKEVEKIKAAVAAQGGNVFAEETPKLIPLAYQIVIRTDAGATRYDKAYFGWVKFTCEPENVSKVDAFAKANKNLIRFILVKTERGNTIQFHKAAALRKEEDAPEDGDIKQDVVVEGEMDKQIDDLVVA